MKFMESDMAAYAESMPLETTPGTAWNYHDGNTVILAHLIRQAAGGSAADMMRFARQELFAPLGMRHVAIEFDASGNAKARARCWRARATGRASASSISTTASPAESASCRKAG